MGIKYWYILTVFEEKCNLNNILIISFSNIHHLVQYSHNVNFEVTGDIMPVVKANILPLGVPICEAPSAKDEMFVSLQMR